MMKKYTFILGIALMGLVIAYQISFIHSARLYQQQKQELEANREAITKEEASDEAEVIMADAGAAHDYVLQSAQIITESYDKDGNLMSREVTVPNAELVGKDRLGVMMYANDYKKHAAESEVKQGLERMVVESFTPDTVTLVKYYGEPIDEPGYWIAVRDNIVIVYTEDKSEIYEFTNIEMWQLPLDIQSELVDGIYVNNERELFDFLQTYSS